MKQFNVKDYLDNPQRKVVTRDGRKVRIICTDKKGLVYPIVALVTNTVLHYSFESCFVYTSDGLYDANDNDSEAHNNLYFED